MTYTIRTHDAWGVVPVGSFESLEEARQAFSSLCQDPWYRQDGSVKALELACELPARLLISERHSVLISITILLNLNRYKHLQV